MLRADFLAQIDVLFFQLRVEGADFFIRFHVLHRERNLIGYFLQELSIRNRVFIGFVAGEVQSSNNLPSHDQRSDTYRTYSLLRKQAFGGRFPLLFQVSADQRALVIERPTGMAVGPVKLTPNFEKLRGIFVILRKDSEGISFRNIQSDRGTTKRQDALQRRADGAQQLALAQFSND